MAAKIADKVSIIMIIHVLRPGQLSRKKSKMAANNTESTITFS